MHGNLRSETLRVNDEGSHIVGSDRVQVDGLAVIVTVSGWEPAAGSPNGSTIAVVDALAGRGPALATVLDAPPEIVDALAQVGGFLRGQSAPPPIPGR